MSAPRPPSFCSKPENQFSAATVYNTGDIVCYEVDGKLNKYIRLQFRGDAGHHPEDTNYPGIWSRYRDKYDSDKTYKCGDSVKKDNIIYISNAKTPSKGTDDLIKFINLKEKTAEPVLNDMTCGPFEQKPVKLNVNASDFSEDAVSGPANVNGTNVANASGPVFEAVMGGYKKISRKRGHKSKKSRRSRRR